MYFKPVLNQKNELKDLSYNLVQEKVLDKWKHALSESAISFAIAHHPRTFLFSLDSGL